MQALEKWDEIVINSILADKAYGIKQVNNFELFSTLTFNKDRYPEIIHLINEQDWGALKTFDNPNRTGFREYLVVIKFSDENQKLHVATVYDSDELMQDPQIVDIITLT
ncbi:MAG: hypothetical protein ABIT58_02225 [Ferruginibacter sp.]